MEVSRHQGDDSQLVKDISVIINGTKYEVSKSYSAVTLNEFLRTNLHLTGTKVMCREGGCGVCTVHAAFPDPSGSGKVLQRSINSCLCPVLSCDGWEIITVEGLGDQNHPHPIQQKLTDHYGTQCGYCTPGFVMSMYSVLQNHPNGTLTQKIVEDSLDGNICRCTGYRPILDAFKSFANREFTTDGLAVDLEDLGSTVCAKTGKKCMGKCGTHEVICVKPLSSVVSDNAPPWYKPKSLEELYNLKRKLSGKKTYYLVGHTGVGVYDDGPYEAFVDMKNVKKLFEISKTEEILSIGAGVSLTDLIIRFRSEAVQAKGFQYLEQLAVTINKTAHVALRNVGSIGGNLAMKNMHNEFPSDSFTCLAVSDARIIIGPEEKSYSADEFLEVDMKGKLILRIEMKTFSEDYFFRTFKVMPRSQNSHGYVNAGFRVKLQRDHMGKFIVTEKPRIALGNISSKFVYASKTEAFLEGKNLADEEVLQEAIGVLQEELQPEEKEDEASPEYRTALCVSLFYKFVLEIVTDQVDDRYRSGVGALLRPLSTGIQSYQTHEQNWPLTKPIPKLESMAQSTGQAKFISDIDEEGMLHAAFATSTQGNAAIFRIDSSSALAVPGVVKVFTADDITGKNSFSSPPAEVEELLAKHKVSYFGQPLAIVVAVTKIAAEEGAKQLKVEYSDFQAVILTVRDAIRQKSFFNQPDETKVGGDAEKAIEMAPRKISGELELGSQAHFHMETQTAVVYPTEDGLDVEAGTQWIDHVQDAISRVCGIDKNTVNVKVKRNGGAFGAKVTRNNIISAATALAAFLTRRPVKMHMSLWDNAKAIGKRFPYYVKYHAGFDHSGKLLGIKMDIYGNLGAQKNDSPLKHSESFIDSVYKCPAWHLTFHSCKTNLPANTYCRAPGSTEAVYFIESIMEHVAVSLGKNAIEVKKLNFYSDGDTTVDGSKLSDVRSLQVTEQLLRSAGVADRQESIGKFNRLNRWKKRGLAVVPLRYAATWMGFSFNCLVSIYHNGGMVAVTHGGIEMGQGINTKVAQVVAHQLGIDMKYVKIQPTQAITNANGFATGGSMTSELACLAAIDCCKDLKERIEPMRKVNPGQTWEETIEACYYAGTDLSARAWVAPKTTQPANYSTYACTATEVELDVLTGEYQINRMDILYDCGESMSPLVDIGQVEGAVVMGIGYYTSEEVLFAKTTGANLTHSTWKYKPPMSKDIPIDLRVELLHNAPNPTGILRSKLVAEPPLCTTCSVVFALREAIKANIAEKEESKTDEWIRIVAPLTVERAQQLCRTDVAQLRYRE